MRPEDAAEFGNLLKGAMSFYGQEVTPFALSVWWQSCQGVSLEQVRKAMTAHAMDPDRGHFAPKPADIVRVLQGTHTDRSLVAWGVVYEAMQRVGAYESVDFGDMAVHCAIEDLGGWTNLCRSTVEQLGWLQKRFCETYRAYNSRAEAVRQVSHLVGYHEVTNRTLGRKAPQPVACWMALQNKAVPRLEGSA